MITKIFLKTKPRTSIDYPDCYPYFPITMSDSKNIAIYNINHPTYNVIAEYYIDLIAKIEFRP